MRNTHTIADTPFYHATLRCVPRALFWGLGRYSGQGAMLSIAAGNPVYAADRRAGCRQGSYRKSRGAETSPMIPRNGDIREKI
jgi:hypothetical protein